MWFFTGTTIKTVDDHCGYAFPWDPLQHITSNNAAYHDIHHQSWGIKTNFSQPYFTRWDTWLGTKWTGGDVSVRYERSRLAAQEKLDAETRSITNSIAQDSKPAPYAAEADNAAPVTKAFQADGTPKIPAGKASLQALGSRQQVLDDQSVSGGLSVLRDEDAEEREAQKVMRRSPRKKSLSTPSAGLKGLRDRVNTSLHGRGSAVLGVESTH